MSKWVTSTFWPLLSLDKYGQHLQTLYMGMYGELKVRIDMSLVLMISDLLINFCLGSIDCSTKHIDILHRDFIFKNGQLFKYMEQKSNVLYSPI